MTNNLLITSTFNTQFGECLQEISDLYPEESKLKKYGRYVESVKKMNPSLLIKAWKKHITDKYEIQIEKGDLEYFLTKDYEEDVASLEKTKPVEEIIEYLRTMMSDMSSENKTRSFQYIQNLTKLSKHYV
jgi:hypothetical protein